MADKQEELTRTAPRRSLSLFDSVCLTVGVIVGVGIYEMAPQVAAAVDAPWKVCALWLCGGFLSLLGALCYAELAATYPFAGGDYVYLTRAYGRWAGFLFGWFQCTLVRPGDIAVIAWVFGHHFALLTGHWFPWAFESMADATRAMVWSVLAVLLLTAIHYWSVRTGKWTQNVLTIAKVAGIGLLVAAAWSVPQGQETSQPGKQPGPPVSLALILVMFTYGGWSDMALIAAEVRHPERNMLRGLVTGTLLVTAIYLLMNVAFLHVLGHAGMASSRAVAQDTVGVLWPQWGGPLMNALICLSAFGALSGLILAGARISYALGTDHPVFAWLGRWDVHADAPRRALLVQGLIAVTMLLALGGMLQTVMYTSGAVYVFFAATTLAVFVLRYKEPQRPRPYRVTGYPIPVIVFALVSACLAYSAVNYKPWHTGAMALYLVVGLTLYGVQKLVKERGSM